MNPTTCSCENEIYLESIIDCSAITFDEIIEPFDEDAETEAKSNDEAKLYDKF